MINYLLAAIFIIASIFLICYSCVQLSHKNGSDIRVVWYFFSLSLVATSGIIWWAIEISAIDKHGSFHGYVGETIQHWLHFMLDLNTDLIIFSAIVALIAVPQLLCYILSGLFGSASVPFLIEESFKFFVWSLVKSFAVASGIFVSLAGFGIWNQWTGWNWQGSCALVFMSVVLVMLAFTTLLLYREAKSVLADLRKTIPEWIYRPIRVLHTWFMRNGHGQEQR